MVLILDSELEVNSPSISLEGIENDIIVHKIRYHKLYDEANILYRKYYDFPILSSHLRKKVILNVLKDNLSLSLSIS